MKAHLIDTHLVPKSRSSAKVKVRYQGHVSQKMGVSGASVLQKHILFYMDSWLSTLLYRNANSCCLRRDLFALTAEHLDDNVHVGKQQVAWMKYCSEYWLKSHQGKAPFA